MANLNYFTCTESSEWAKLNPCGWYRYPIDTSAWRHHHTSDNMFVDIFCRIACICLFYIVMQATFSPKNHELTYSATKVESISVVSWNIQWVIFIVFISLIPVYISYIGFHRSKQFSVCILSRGYLQLSVMSLLCKRYQVSLESFVFFLTNNALNTHMTHLINGKGWNRNRIFF